MTKLTPHTVKLDAHEDGDTVCIHPASPESVKYVLSQSENGDDGRSQYVWVRLPNGDLILGVYPQGDTYLSVEGDAHYPGSWTEIDSKT